MASDRNVILGIQHLRGFAATIVAIYHGSRMAWPQGAAEGGFKSLAGGDFGLQLFFVISGFIITIVCLAPDSSARLSLSEFAKRRFLRIVPLMWIAILFYTALKAGSGADLDWLETLRSLILWPVGELKPGVIWTLRLELCFYALFAVTALISPQRLWVIGIWALLPLLTRLMAPYLPWLNTAPAGDSFVWVHLMGHQVGANLQFGMGMVLGLLWNRGHAVFRSKLPIGFVMLLVACILGLLIDELLMRTALWDVVKILLQTALMTGIVLLALKSAPDLSPQGKIGKLLGDASYSIYLFHALFQLILAKAIAIASGLIVLPTILIFAIITVLSIAGGILVHIYLERPLTGGLAARLHRTTRVRVTPART